MFLALKRAVSNLCPDKDSLYRTLARTFIAPTEKTHRRSWCICGSQKGPWMIGRNMRENLIYTGCDGIRWGKHKSKGDSLVKYLANLEDGQRSPRVRIQFKEIFSLFLFKEENKIRECGIIKSFFYSILMISSFASYVNGKMSIPSSSRTRTGSKDSSVSS